MLWCGVVSRSWPLVAGRILTSEVKWDESGGAAAIFPAVTYAYEVGGTEHVSDRVAFGFGGWSQERAETVIARYPSGGLAEVRYDPSRPSRAVLIAGTRLAPMIGAVFGVVMAVGGLVILVALARGFR